MLPFLCSNLGGSLRPSGDHDVMGHAVMTTNRHNMLGTTACVAYCLILLHTWPAVFTAMSASSDDAAKDDQAPSFGYKGCPLGDDECPKAKQWLGGTKQSFSSERRCRQAVLDHLMCSPYHNEMTSTEVTMKKTTGMAMMYEQQLNMKGGENWAVSKVIVDVENLKCKRCWTKTEPKKSKKRSKAMKAMKTMKAVKAMKVMKAKNPMITMKAVRYWGPRIL